MSNFARPRITEKRYLEIPPTVLTIDGTADGVITINNTYCFKVGQLVLFVNNSSRKVAKIQRVISDTKFIVIEPSESVITNNKLDMSLFPAGSTVESSEIKRPVIDLLEIQRQVYEEEPTVALRTHSVDWLGRSYDVLNPVQTASTPPARKNAQLNNLVNLGKDLSTLDLLINDDCQFITLNDGTLIYTA